MHRGWVGLRAKGGRELVPPEQPNHVESFPYVFGGLVHDHCRTSKCASHPRDGFCDGRCLTIFRPREPSLSRGKKPNTEYRRAERAQDEATSLGRCHDRDAVFTKRLDKTWTDGTQGVGVFEHGGERRVAVHPLEGTKYRLSGDSGVAPFHRPSVSSPPGQRRQSPRRIPN